ncbi:MAG TPA: hypothetical protein VN671_04530, partial [Solirubrobacterales bacterium]|nr:hypothetical protein [Solirubrobacterales bacterium]
LDLMSPEYRDRLVARRAGYQVIWEDVLAAGVESGEFLAPDPVFVKGVLGMHNYSYLWLREDGRLTPEQVGDRFCDVLLAGLHVAGGNGGGAER